LIADFLLTPSGDVCFTEVDTDENKLTINFFKSPSPVLKINFNTENTGSNNIKNNTLIIKFDVYKTKYNKKIELVKSNAYVIQQIIIRLKTVLGELSLRSDAGSLLETVMHKDLNDVKVKSQVEKIVANAISDLLDDCTVSATPIVKYDNGYKQIMNIQIYNYGDLLLTYETE
jgi:phage baseplate assembly protein W